MARRAERRQTRIAIDKAVVGRASFAVPCRQHRQGVDALDRHLGAQLVEIELLREVVGQRFRAIDEEAAAVIRAGFDHEEIGDDLALRRQQRGVARSARRQRLDIAGHKVVEKSRARVRR